MPLDPNGPIQACLHSRRLRNLKLGGVVGCLQYASTYRLL